MTNAIERLAAYGLPGNHPSAFEVPASEWPDFTRRLSSDRLFGLAAAAGAAGTLQLTTELHDWLADQDEAWQHNALERERLLVSVHNTFTDAGVDHRFFKGPALAHTVYDLPNHRVFADIDVLVPGTQLAQARAALVQHLDGTDVYPDLRPGFDAEFAKDVLIRVDDIEVDLHRTVAAGPFGMRIPTDELFDQSATFTLGGQSLPTLGATATFLQVCYNAALGDVPPRLGSLRDVAQVHHAQTGDFDHQVMLSTARRWGGETIVAKAVATTWQTLGLEPCELSQWATSYQPSPFDRALFAASITENRGYTRALASLAAIPGTRAKGRYLRAIAFPSGDYLAARHWTRGNHLRRAIDRLRPSRR